MLLRFLRRNKQLCVQCGNWTGLAFVGDWCRTCAVAQSQLVLKMCGTVLGLRILSRGGKEIYLKECIDDTNSLIGALPEEARNKKDLYRVLNAAVNCELPEGK